MINEPKTYAEWVDVLDQLQAKTNDAAVLAAIQKGRLEWQVGVAERFTKRLLAAVNHRLNAAGDKFQREMSRAGGQEAALVEALLSLRRELSYLMKAVNIPSLPDEIKEQTKN